MNKTLAAMALKALRDPAFPSRKGLCQMWVRLVVEAALGHGWAERLHEPSAREAALRAVSERFGEYYKGQVIDVGTILYKIHGSPDPRTGKPFGHVGIYVGKIKGVPMVAENSSWQARRQNGEARGLRSLQQFGHFDVIVRLKDPNAASTPAVSTPTATPRLLLVTKTGKLVQESDYHEVKSAHLSEGRFYADSTELLALLAGGNHRVAVEPFLERLGAAVYDKGVHLDDKVNPRVYLFVDVTER